MTAPKTQGDRLDELTAKLDELTVFVRQELAAAEVEIRELRESKRDTAVAMRQQQDACQQLSLRNTAQDERLKVLEKHSDHPATFAAHDQRLRGLEKGTDRLWQFAPIVLSASALLVAAYVAFVKK